MFDRFVRKFNFKLIISKQWWNKKIANQFCIFENTNSFKNRNILVVGIAFYYFIVNFKGHVRLSVFSV